MYVPTTGKYFCNFSCFYKHSEIYKLTADQSRICLSKFSIWNAVYRNRWCLVNYKLRPGLAKIDSSTWVDMPSLQGTHHVEEHALEWYSTDRFFRHVTVSQSKYISAAGLVQPWVYSLWGYCNGLVPQSGIIVTYLRQFRFLSHMITANLTWDPLVTLDSTADSVRKSQRPVHS